MSPDDLRRLEAAGAEAEVAAGRVLIERGQQGTGLFVVVDGTVVVEAQEGALELGPGSVVGERSLFSADGRRTARVRAATDCRVVAVERVEVDRLCAEDAAFAQRLADATASPPG